ncbi:MAG TPA: hypothetical protein DCR97_07200 [Deltaproteobacteria bacterium]|jgi:DNA-binding protein HU-beta|nr:hypothetical protein [Deltaproteobacteria bacterium]
MAKATRVVCRDDLVSTVAQSTDLTKENARKAIHAVLEGILLLLEQAAYVRLANFGVFSLKETKERAGINPKTQEPITVPAGCRIGFKVSKVWKDEMLARRREQAKEKVKVTPKVKPAGKPTGKPAAKGKKR